MTKSGAESVSSRRSARRKHYRKSAETQARLMEAAIACLYEDGFQNLTLQSVADRASVTRSAIQYYANTTPALLFALQEYLVDKIWGEELRKSLALPIGPESHAQAIDIIFDHVDSRYFIAWNELLIAARTDDALKAIVDRGNELRENIHARLTGIFHVGASEEQMAKFRALDDLFVLVLHAATFVTFDGDSGDRVRAAKRILRDLYVQIHAETPRNTCDSQIDD